MTTRISTTRASSSPTAFKQWHAVDSEKNWLLKDLLVPKALVLKEGAQVMLLKNDPKTRRDADNNIYTIPQKDRLVNGSRGIVIGFGPDFRHDEAAAEAWHSVQSGQRKEEEAYANLEIWPIVEFENGVLNGGSHKVKRVVTREKWDIEQAGKVVASRHQVPLKLAWAISVHKSQGMTLQAAELDLAKCFDDGMAYVALSRVVSLKCTRIVSFEPRKVTANQKVVEFYQGLEAKCPPLMTASQGGAAASSQEVPGGSQGGGGSSSQGGGGGLTAEQKERMAKKKAEALAKKQQKQQQNQPPQQPPPPPQQHQHQPPPGPYGMGSVSYGPRRHPFEVPYGPPPSAAPPAPSSAPLYVD